MRKKIAKQFLQKVTSLNITCMYLSSVSERERECEKKRDREREREIEKEREKDI